MKKIASLILLIMFFALFGCHKKPNDFVYVENTDFLITSNASLTKFTKVNRIDIENNSNIKDIDYVNKCLIVENLTSGKVGVIGIDNKEIIPQEYKAIYKEYSKYVLVKEDSVAVYEIGKGIIKSFSKGELKVLFDNVIAFFPEDSYKIIINDLRNGKTYEIYDKKKNKENIFNYGKYLIYKNVEFSEFQVFSIDGVNVYTLPQKNTFTNLVYIGMDNFFIYEQSIIDNEPLELNSLYNLNSKQLKELKLSESEIIYSVKNEGNSETINVKTGFSSFLRRNGINFYADGNLDRKKEFYGAEFNLIDNYSFIVSAETSNLDTKTKIFNNAFETVKEFKAEMLIGSVSLNNNILTYGTSINNNLKYKAVTVLNEPVITDTNYDYLSIFVDGVAIGKIGETYYRVNANGTKTVMDEQNIIVLKGAYYFKSSDKIIVKNYDGSILIEGDYNDIFFKSLSYNNNSSLTLSTPNGISFFFLS